MGWSLFVHGFTSCCAYSEAPLPSREMWCGLSLKSWWDAQTSKHSVDEDVESKLVLVPMVVVEEHWGKSLSRMRISQQGPSATECVEDAVVEEEWWGRRGCAEHVFNNGWLQAGSRVHNGSILPRGATGPPDHSASSLPWASRERNKKREACWRHCCPRRRDHMRRISFPDVSVPCRACS